MIPQVRPAKYDSDASEIISILQRNVPQLPHDVLFPWLYLEAPEGQALAWVAVDSQSSRIVGAAAAFPRRLLCEGREAKGYVLGDFCIDQEHRSLGLAVMLQRACLQDLASGDAEFVFDFPSGNMMAVYKRLRIEATYSMARCAKPLRADRQVSERVPIAVVARGLSAAANSGLRLLDARVKTESDLQMALEPGPWKSEFSLAAAQWSPRYGTCVIRTARYLNWRYGEHPDRRYQMLTARQNGRLRGYLVYFMNGQDCTVDDALAEDDSVLESLLARLTKLARERQVHTVSMPAVKQPLVGKVLEKCGFRQREATPVVVLERSQGQLRPARGGWYLTHGDGEA